MERDEVRERDTCGICIIGSNIYDVYRFALNTFSRTLGSSSVFSSTQGYLMVTFQSDGSGHAAGFEGNWSIWETVPVAVTCSGSLSLSLSPSLSLSLSLSLSVCLSLSLSLCLSVSVSVSLSESASVSVSVSVPVSVSISVSVSL